MQDIVQKKQIGGESVPKDISYIWAFTWKLGCQPSARVVRLLQCAACVVAAVSWQRQATPRPPTSSLSGHLSYIVVPSIEELVATTDVWLTPWIGKLATIVAATTTTTHQASPGNARGAPRIALATPQHNGLQNPPKLSAGAAHGPYHLTALNQIRRGSRRAWSLTTPQDASLFPPPVPHGLACLGPGYLRRRDRPHRLPPRAPRSSSA